MRPAIRNCRSSDSKTSSVRELNDVFIFDDFVENGAPTVTIQGGAGDDELIANSEPTAFVVTQTDGGQVTTVDSTGQNSATSFFFDVENLTGGAGGDESTLATAIDTTATTLTVADATGFPADARFDIPLAGGFQIEIGAEKLDVTAVALEGAFSTLNGAIAAADTTLVVNDASDFPTTPFRCPDQR